MRVGIQSKWAALSAVAVGAALLLSASVSIGLVQKEMRDSARDASKNTATLLAKFSEEAVVPPEDILTLQKAVDTTTRQPGIRYAVVFDLGGKVLAAAPGGVRLIDETLPALLGDDDEAAARVILGEDATDLVNSRRPVTLAGVAAAEERTLAWVRVGYSPAFQKSKTQAFVGKLAAVSALGLGVGILLCVGLARTFARPVLRLEALAQNVAKGNFKAKSEERDIRREDEIGDLSKAFNRMTDFLERGQFVRHAFERYVSSELAERIYQDPSATAAGLGDRREVTILFLDIRGFTKFSESMSAEDVVKFLVNFFNRVSEPVFRGEGAIDKFIGDSMLAVFGFPIAHADDPHRAVAAAVRIREIVKEYNRERFSWGLAPVGVGIGINTGMVVAGNVGCERKLDYTIIGDAVNLASRLCALAKAHEILVSDSTYARVRSHVNAESLGEQQVKGREQAVEIFRIQDLSQEVSGAA